MFTAFSLFSVETTANLTEALASTGLMWFLVVVPDHS